MRIICDHCGQPISGAVKRMPEHLNFHPECLVETDKGTEHEATPAAWMSQEGSVSGWMEDGRN